jgi:hypothetical protein
MVLSNAVPGREDEFNTWYDRIHAPIVIEEDDFVWAQRFELSADQFAGNGTPELKQRRFLVIFGVETNDIKGTLAAVSKRLAQYRNVQSSSMAPSLQAVSWKALGPPITQKDAQLLLAEEEAAGRVPKKGTPAPPGFRGRGGGPGAGGPPPDVDARPPGSGDRRNGGRSMTNNASSIPVLHANPLARPIQGAINSTLCSAGGRTVAMEVKSLGKIQPNGGRTGAVIPSGGHR